MMRPRGTYYDAGENFCMGMEGSIFALVESEDIFTK